MKSHLRHPASKSDDKKALPSTHIQNKVVIWPISFGQTTEFISDKGIASLRLLAAHEGPTYIFPANTLARHNYQVENELNPQGALDLARKKGQEWLKWFDKEQTDERDKHNGSKKISDVAILDWEYWQQQAGYKAIEDKVEQLFNSNDNGFRDAVVKTAAAFATNRIASHPGKMASLYEASIAYLKEEVIVTLLWIKMLQEKHPNTKIVQLYPKDPNPVLVHLYNKILTAEQRSNFEFLTIEFVSEKRLAPKHTEANANVSESISPPQAGSPSQAEGHLRTFYETQLTMYTKLLETQNAQIQFQREQIATLMNHVFSQGMGQQQYPQQQTSHTDFTVATLSSYAGTLAPPGSPNLTSPQLNSQAPVELDEMTSPRITAGCLQKAFQ